MRCLKAYKKFVAFALILPLCLLSMASFASGGSDYGVVSARSLNLRAAPSTGARVIASYPSGTWVQVLETANGWHKVRAEGTVGYMSARYVKLDEITKVTDAQVSGAGGYINLRFSASLNAGVLATFPNGTRVKILSRADGFYRVQVGSLTGYMADHLIRLDSINVSTYAVITTANGGRLNLRSAPSTSAGVLQSFSPGTGVEVLEKGAAWHKVRVRGVIGYMMAQHVTLGGAGVSLPTGGTGVVKNPRATQVLNLREAASLHARVLACYRSGKRVEILGATGDWYRVRVDGMTGYMMKKYIRVADAPAPHPATPFAARLFNPNGNAIVNFRERPSLNGRVLAAHPAGKAVTVLQYHNADWAKVSINNVTGYVSAYFLRY